MASGRRKVSPKDIARHNNHSAHERARKVLKDQLVGEAGRKARSKTDPKARAEAVPERPHVVRLVRTTLDPETFGLYRHFFAIQDNDGVHMRRIGHLLEGIQTACNNRFVPVCCQLTIDDTVFAVTIFAAEHQVRQAQEFAQRLMNTKTDLAERWFPGLDDSIAAWVWTSGDVLLCWTVHDEVAQELLTSLRSR